MRDYKKLDVWKKAHLLTKQVYNDILPLMPVEERFALTNQLRRSTYSIPLNIVLGSAHEVEYTCYLIYDLGFISENKYEVINVAINEVKAMLISFIKFL